MTIDIKSNCRFIPTFDTSIVRNTWNEDAMSLRKFLREYTPAVITGAGLSTSAGIPCYRGEKGSYSHGHVPLQHAEFVQSKSKRKRYWARSLRGFEYFHRRTFTRAHQLLAKELNVGRIVTQNVDRLHHQAGSKGVVELHGRGDRVVCLKCNEVESRKKFTDRMREANRTWIQDNKLRIFADEEGDDIRADGDAHLESNDFETFHVPSCRSCGHEIVMPDLVFFGGSIPGTVKEQAAKIVDEADGLLIVGSSCSTYSAFSLVRRAQDASKPIAMINIGPTRVDDMVDDGMKFEYPIDSFLEEVAEDETRNFLVQ